MPTTSEPRALKDDGVRSCRGFTAPSPTETCSTLPRALPRLLPPAQGTQPSPSSLPSVGPQRLLPDAPIPTPQLVPVGQRRQAALTQQCGGCGQCRLPPPSRGAGPVGGAAVGGTGVQHLPPQPCARPLTCCGDQGRFRSRRAPRRAWALGRRSWRGSRGSRQWGQPSGGCRACSRAATCAAESRGRAGPRHVQPWSRRGARTAASDVGPRPGSRGHSLAASPAVTCRETRWPRSGSRAAAGLHLAQGPCGSPGGCGGARSGAVLRHQGTAPAARPFPAEAPQTLTLSLWAARASRKDAWGQDKAVAVSGASTALAGAGGEAQRLSGCTVLESLTVP